MLKRSQKYAVRVRVNPDRLAQLGIGIDEVRTSLATNNVNLPAGTLDGPNKAVTLVATGQLKSAEGFRKVIVTYRNGAAVRLGDVANVMDSIENDKTASWFKTDRAMILMVQRQPGTNTIKVVDGVKALLPSFRSQLPASVNLEIYSDRSVSIRDSVEDVKFTLVLAILLVVLVIFLGIGLNLNPREVPSPLIGKPAPAFKLSELKESGKVLGKEDMLGKVWLLNVWASWCVSCREEHPVLVELSKTNVVPIIGLNYKDQRKCRSTSIGVNNSSTSKIQSAQFKEPTAGREYPVRNWCINNY